MVKKAGFMGVGLGIVAFLIGCGTTSINKHEVSSGAIVEQQEIRGGRITSELKSILETTPVQGEGSFIAENKTAAIMGAEALALNNLAEKVGEVIIEANTSVITTEDKNKIVGVVRKQSRNIIKGWDYLVPPQWDEKTHEAKVIVSMNVEQTVTEIAKKAGFMGTTKGRSW